MFSALPPKADIPLKGPPPSAASLIASWRRNVAVWHETDIPSAFYSSPWTGGAVVAVTTSGVLATGGTDFTATASAGLVTGSGATFAAPSSFPALACVTRRARGRDVGCPTPQECAIAGPAVYPINAPATAPTGPRTTAPDTAPKAALPARSWALASNEKHDPTISTATSCFFIAIPPGLSQAGRDAAIAATERSGPDAGKRSLGRSLNNPIE